MKKAISIAALTVTALGLLAYFGKLSPLLSSAYLPHRFCYLAEPWLVWTNVTTDGLIAASYGVIFGCLFWVASKLRRLPEVKAHVWIFIAFGTFILACGATHAMEIVTVWWPVYPLSAVVKIVCAAASVPTAILFAWVTPKLAESVGRFVHTLSSSQQEKEQAMRALVAQKNWLWQVASPRLSRMRSRIPCRRLAICFTCSRTIPGFRPTRTVCASAPVLTGNAEGFGQAELKPLPGYSITIADSGPGIEAKHRQRLFALFFTTKGEQGTGLGLWLVRSMVEKQGGQIRVRSRTASESAQTGTIVNIWIPLAPASFGLSPEEAALASPRNGNEVASTT